MRQSQATRSKDQKASSFQQSSFAPSHSEIST